MLTQLGFECDEADDPYAAFVELCNHRLAYHALVLSLASLYREELSIITAVKYRLPHIDIWLTQTDGRQAAPAEGVSFGQTAFWPKTGCIESPIRPMAPPGGCDREPGSPPQY